MSTSSLIQQAFGIKGFQILGAPGWVTSDGFDLIATYGTPKDLNDKELRPYLQALLKDRFQFQYHRESKEMQIYSLTVAKAGLKLTPHEGEGDSSTSISTGSAKASITSRKCTMAHLADLLGARMDRVVVDNTGLAGGFDFKLEWAPNPTAESSVPSIFTALQEQLGLKLETTKGPVDIIVVDSVERPSEN